MNDAVTSADLDRGPVVGVPVEAQGNPGVSVKQFVHRGEVLEIDMIHTAKADAARQVAAWRAALDAEAALIDADEPVVEAEAAQVKEPPPLQAWLDEQVAAERARLAAELEAEILYEQSGNPVAE